VNESFGLTQAETGAEASRMLALADSGYTPELDAELEANAIIARNPQQFGLHARTAAVARGYPSNNGSVTVTEYDVTNDGQTWTGDEIDRLADK
jgi:hypothetical protein